MYYISMKLSITVPTELKDLTLGQYQKFVKNTLTRAENFSQESFIESYSAALDHVIAS